MTYFLVSLHKNLDHGYIDLILGRLCIAWCLKKPNKYLKIIWNDRKNIFYKKYE